MDKWELERKIEKIIDENCEELPWILIKHN